MYVAIVYPHMRPDSISPLLLLLTIYVFIWIARSLDLHFGWELCIVVFGLLIKSLCEYFREVSSLCSLFCWLCLLGLYGRCRIYPSYLPLLSRLYGFLYIPQVYVLVFQLVRHICGRLRCCVDL